jgi:prepilin-type N-terminal cleavage/methylation domain-containing protein
MKQAIYCVVATRRRTKRNKLISKKKGFTLIELLVVVLIIGILAAIALPQYKQAVYNSRMKQIDQLLSSIYTAFNEYQLVHGKGSIPANVSEIGWGVPQGCSVETSGNIWNCVTNLRVRIGINQATRDIYAMPYFDGSKDGYLDKKPDGSLQCRKSNVSERSASFEKYCIMNNIPIS